MAPEILQRQDLSIYVVAGVPKSFKKRLQKFVEAESKSEGEILLLDDEMADWTLARVRGEKRRSHEQTPASSALWRAFRALSAARYHLQDNPMEERIREVRDQIEALWRDISPIVEVEGEGEPEEELEGVG
ncbi:MAG: hypothetical protein WD056_00830 [Gemmatimonadota bacterium]